MTGNRATASTLAPSPARLAADTLHIACGADTRYAPYCGAMLHSLFARNAGRQIHIHYLCAPEFPVAMRELLARLVQRHQATLEFHVIADSDVAGLPAMRNIQRLVWYRTFLPELLPALERILYLDADTLVIDTLEPLWNTELGGRLFAAVPNVIHPSLRAERLRALGLPEAAPYFNSGVMLMDLVAMRRQGFTQRVLDYARQAHARLIWGDQDAINAVFPESWLALHPRWNCMNSLFYWAAARHLLGDPVVNEAISRPAVLHFEGPDIVKPWHYLSRHPYRAAYQAHLHATGIPVPAPIGRTVGNALLRHLPEAALSFLARVLRRLGLSNSFELPPPLTRGPVSP